MRRRIFCLAAAALLLLSGCRPAPDTPEEEVPLPSEETEIAPEEVSLLPERFSLPYQPDQPLDPITCPDGMQQTVASLICEGLFRLNGALEPEPCLCERYTADEAHLTYTFTLRAGVVFSDGAPLTAADGKAALERARTSARYGARLRNVASLSAAGDTLTVTLSAPDGRFPSLLDIPISRAGEEANIPLGTGPYLFAREESGAYLVASETWRQSGERPVERIFLEEAADGDAALYRFTSRDVQLITADLTGASPVSVTGDVRYQDAPTTVMQYLLCNTRRQPLDSASLRRALGLGINRGYLVSALLSGHGDSASAPVSPVSALYPRQLEESYSAAAFSAALAECGYVSERTLALLVNRENPFKVSAAEHLARTFTSAGVPTEAVILPWEEYTAALEAGNFDLCYSEVKLAANWDLSALLSSAGTLNYGGWADEETDRLLSAYAAASDPTGAMQVLCTHLRSCAPILPICFKRVSVLTWPDVVTLSAPTAAEPFFDLSNCAIRLREG